jgi:hypothetical protein
MRERSLSFLLETVTVQGSHIHEVTVILAGQHETGLKGRETVLKKQRM